ncbi:uncharacterized protein LOC106653565 isoform X1 [Trichogramma pretiosum]|uniref:uncharacterized protein LOC106653565 isoform X1 n=1 Tax=Trichogramma pretiosum TaxID=7493 RepID=UPI0006C9D5B1|nr:uncharacterized protein LOC106653565 isoform X1 [Trichogramma pretiosum]
MASLSILYAVYLSKNNMEPTQALLDLDSTSYKMSAILGDSTLVTEAQVDELIKGFQGILNYNESSDDDDDDEDEQEEKKKVATTSTVEQPLRLDIDFSRVCRRKQPASKKKDDDEDESRYIKKGPIRPKTQQHNHHQAREKPYHDQATSHNNNCQQQQQQVLDTSDDTSSSDFDFGAQAIMTDPTCRQQIHDCLDKLTELNQDAASAAPWLSPVDFSSPSHWHLFMEMLSEGLLQKSIVDARGHHHDLPPLHHRQKELDWIDKRTNSNSSFFSSVVDTLKPSLRSEFYESSGNLSPISDEDLFGDDASDTFEASLGDFRQPTTPSSISSSGQSCNGADNNNPSPLAYQRSIEPHLEDDLCSSAAMGPRFIDTTTATTTNTNTASFNYVNYDLVEEVIRHDLEPRSISGSNKNTLSSAKSSILDSFLNQDNYAPPYPNHVAPSPTTTTTTTTNYVSPDSYPRYQNCAMTTTSPEQQQQANDVAGSTLLAATYHSPNHGNHSPPVSILSPASDSAYYNNNNNANGYCSGSSNLHLSPSNCSSPGSNPGGVVSPNSRSTSLGDHHYQWHSTPQLSGAYSYAKMTFSPDPQLDGRYLPMQQQQPQQPQQQQQQSQNFSPNSCSNGTSYSVPSLTGTLSPRQDPTDLYYETSTKTSNGNSSGVNPHERETFIASPLDELVQAVRHTLPTLDRQAQELNKRCLSIRSDDLSSKAANSSIGPSFDNFPIPTTVTEYTSRYKSAQKDELHFANPWSMLDSREINMCPRLKELIDPQSLAASMLQVQRKSVDELVTPDKDGDTLLLRFMGNSIELRRKLAYVPPLIKRICAMSADHLTVENKRGEDALFLACVRSPHLAFLARYLATLFARKNPLIGRKFYRITRCSLLHTLAALGDSHIDVMAKLLEARDENGCQIFHCNILDDNGKTPLHIATEYHERFGPRHSCAKTIRLLLGYGCAPHQLDANKESALHRAVRNTCDPDICELLLKSAAAASSASSVSRTMLRQADVRGNTVLHYVAAAQNPRVQDVSRQEKVCRLLVEAGARFDCKNLRGETPYDLILAERRDALFRISQKE